MRSSQVNHIFYLEVSPEECAKNQTTCARWRNNIDPTYLKRCHDYHDKWLSNTRTPTYVKCFDQNVMKVSGLIDYCVAQNVKT